MKAYDSDFELSAGLIEHAKSLIMKLKTCITNCRLWCLQRADYMANEMTSLEIEQIQRIENLSIRMDQALADNFDTPRALHYLLDLVGNAQPSTHPLILDRIAQILSQFTHHTGLVFSSAADTFLPELLFFRSKMRALGLQTRSAEVLKLCDQFRHDLDLRGISVQDE